MGQLLHPVNDRSTDANNHGALIDLISDARTVGIPFAVPKQLHRVTESQIVKDVLHVLQGFPGDKILWNKSKERFYFKMGTHVSHLSQSSLVVVLRPFLSAATSLRRVEKFIAKASKSINGKSLVHKCPTLEAFANVVSMQLKYLRLGALEKELEGAADATGSSVTLLNLSASLSWVCAGSNFLDHVVQKALPQQYMAYDNASLSSHILSFLFEGLNRFCLLKDGEDEAYRTLLLLFVGSLWPHVQSLDAWLQEGSLSDPFGELYFYANSSLTIQDAAFWQTGYYVRYQSPAASSTLLLEQRKDEESWALVDSKPGTRSSYASLSSFRSDNSPTHERSISSRHGECLNNLACPSFLQPLARPILSSGKSLQLLRHVQRENGGVTLTTSLTQEQQACKNSLFDQFCNSLKNLFLQDGSSSSPKFDLYSLLGSKTSGTTIAGLGVSAVSDSAETQVWERQLGGVSNPYKQNLQCQLDSLANCNLPSLDDYELREAVFSDPSPEKNSSGNLSCSAAKGTNYVLGNGCGRILQSHMVVDRKAMRKLFACPTSLPFFDESALLSDALQYQRQNRASTVMLKWLQRVDLPVTPSSTVIVQECLVSFIEKQVNAVGTQLLEKLMGEWRLMEELALLRAIYLMGSGDLLQQFSFVLFNKLDRGEPWDDFYELNTMLQESVRSSADAPEYFTLDSLVVKMESRGNANGNAERGPLHHPVHFMGRSPIFGIDILDNLRFEYKVAWPLELIIDSDAIKKYNQVMCFLLKVKRAKQALDKACRWMWKGDSACHKQQLLLQMKLMHFVNTLQHYVMDQVLHSSWVELCEGMASARSLDEVIACHDAYLISIQRQCFVAPDKLWTLISSRVKTILGLALDFYSIQRSLFGGGGGGSGNSGVTMAARCQLEIENVGKQFDECIAFLLRVLSFKLNVGHFPHLTDLITRINYNNYYISETGQLLTPIPDLQQHRSKRS